MLIIYWVWNSYPSRLRSKGGPNLTMRTSRIRQTQKPGYLLQPGSFTMPSTCSTSLLYWSYAEQLTCSLS